LGPFILYQPLGFILAFVGLIGKLKRDPLDIPSASSEVVGGSLTEYTGSKLALWHLVMNMQAVVGIFLLINLYLGRSGMTKPIIAIIIFIVECLVIMGMLSATSAVFTRLRIDQLAGVGWRILVPLAFAQLAFVILMGV